MSIRKSPQPTPQLLDAARCNARRSHGPRTAAGKENSKMNGVKHGERSDPENFHEVMRALGEDPARFEALKQELSESFGSGDAFLEKQVDDLARLYWRRDRLERSQTGLMRRALLALEEQQHRRRKEIEGASFEVGQAINITMSMPADPAARLRLQLSFLGVIREQVRGRSFLPWQGAALEGFYKGPSGWRPARLCTLLREFAGRVSKLAEEKARQERAAQDDAAAWLAGAALWGLEAAEGSGGESPAAADQEAQSPTGGDSAALPQAEPSPAPPEPCADPLEELQYRELLALVEVEIAHAEREFEYEEKLNEERAAIERDACLAPSGEEWKLMLRREETLDRSIDRKIKLLLSLRKAVAQPQKPQTLESRSAPAKDVGAPLVGAPTNEQHSPEGRGCQAPALSSAAAARVRAWFRSTQTYFP